MAHQAHNPAVRHSVTPFSNLTREEFEARLMGIAAKGDDV
jgi:cathepsin F